MLIRAAIVLGVVAGIFGALGGAMLVGRALAPPSAPPVATPAPVPTVAPTGAAALPSGVAAGFLQVAAVNDRLARAGSDLKAAMAVKRPSAAAIAPLLRKISAETRSGQKGAARIGAWPAAGTLPADVAALYTAVADVAAEGLGAPLTNDAAYAAAGRRMLAALKPLPAITKATRDAASRAGVVLPTPAPAPSASSSPGG